LCILFVSCCCWISIEEVLAYPYCFQSIHCSFLY
jgi:hypothetical protein